MYHTPFIVLFVCGIVLTADAAVNYCGAKMCGHSNAHTFCKYREGPSPSCAGYVPAALSKAEAVQVVGRLNARRGQLARGWRHWPPAGDMMQLRWMEELAREAQRWADQCRPPRTPEERDVCRDLYSISVGQCVASVVGEAPGLRPETMVDMWYMQSMAYDGNITAYSPSQSKNFYGDFAQMMWARTFLVGCGRSRFMSEWRGRLRSVERLVCNFAPRGPLPSRPLWTPARPAALCPPRTREGSIPGLCTYQNNDDEPRNPNDTLSIHHINLLDTVFEIEKNEPLDYLGRFDELYLTKMAIATISTPAPMIPLYHFVQKGTALKKINEEIEQILRVGNESEVEVNSVLQDQIVHAVTSTRRTKFHKTKLNVIGRPKPYDIDDLSDATVEKKFENINYKQDLWKRKETDLYEDYGLLYTEEDIIMNSTDTEEVTQSIHIDISKNGREHWKLNGFVGVNTTENMNALEMYFNTSGDGLNNMTIDEKSVEDYLSDPETVQALQEALARMEQTLASPPSGSTSGKVRRELRNLEVESQKTSGAEIGTSERPSSDTNSDDAAKERDRNKSKDRGPMLSMVLKYMPYLKAYESTIVGAPSSHSNKVYFELTLFICSLLLVSVL